MMKRPQLLYGNHQRVVTRIVGTPDGHLTRVVPGTGSSYADFAHFWEMSANDVEVHYEITSGRTRSENIQVSQPQAWSP